MCLWILLSTLCSCNCWDSWGSGKSSFVHSAPTRRSTSMEYKHKCSGTTWAWQRSRTWNAMEQGLKCGIGWVGGISPPTLRDANLLEKPWVCNTVVHVSRKTEPRTLYLEVFCYCFLILDILVVDFECKIDLNLQQMRKGTLCYYLDLTNDTHIDGNLCNNTVDSVNP